MTLTVTPGGASDDAYISLADWKAYADAQGWDYSTFSDAALEASIRRGTVFVEGLGVPASGYMLWPGARTTATQRRLWPRTGATYLDGTEIADDAIPASVVDATAEAAWYDFNNPGQLSSTTPEGIKSAGAGPARVEFRDDVGNRAGRQHLTVVLDLLSDILRPPQWRFVPAALVV